MTPFDPVALLAMLLTFYPIVSPAALAQARQERPDYFAGGTLGGSHGDKLILPDGRCFDCIFNVDDPTQPSHWQVIVCGDSGPAGDPVFPLAPGPLTPIDPSVWPPPAPQPIFGPIVGQALHDLGAADQTFDRVLTEIAQASSPADLEAGYHATLGGVDGVVVGSHQLLDGVDPTDVIQATHATGSVIDAREADYDEPLPPDVPDVPPPGTPPIDIPNP